MMTDTTATDPTAAPAARSVEDQQLAEELVERARSEGVDLVGPGGLLAGLTKNVLEASLEAEMSEHLGYDKHDPAGREKGSNSRNGTRSKQLVTEVGPVEIDVPRDRDGTFEPQIVKKHQRRLSGVDELVISLTAKGLTTGEVSAHLAEVYGADVSKDTISRITDKVVEEMSEWQNRPLDVVYPVVFIDAMNLLTGGSRVKRGFGQLRTFATEPCTDGCTVDDQIEDAVRGVIPGDSLWEIVGGMP